VWGCVGGGKLCGYILQLLLILYTQLMKKRGKTKVQKEVMLCM
jgi:hypothetical protein